MSEDTPSIHQRLDQSVAWIEIDRPERRNSLDMASRSELSRAFDEASADPEVRVVVLRGLGGSFSAGVDLKEPPQKGGKHPLLENRDPLVAPLERCSKPIIAAIDGPAIGGGFELALACEIRVATPRSFFALTEVGIGSLPGSGGTQRLFRALPSAVAWKMLLSGERLHADRAHRLGLVSDLIDEDRFDEEVAAIAASVARAAPLSLRAAKLVGAVGMSGASPEAGLAFERAMWAFLATTQDRQEGRSAFREKRKPDYKGR